MGFIASSRSRLATSKGRKSLGICLSISFILITVIIVSSVWSTQWKSRVTTDVPSVLSMGGTTPNTIPPPTPAPTMSTPVDGGSSPTGLAALTPVVDTTVGCNGMESLCSQPVNQILFATVHNAAATRGVVQLPNHDRSMLESLEYGYRGLNLDIGLCDGVFALVHSICALGRAPLVDGLRNITNFVQQNSNQVVLVPVQLDFGTGGEFTMQSLADYVATTVPDFLNLLYVHDGSDTWPTLQQLIDGGTPIIFFHYNGEVCLASGNCPIGGLQQNWFDYAVESGFSFDTTNDVLTESGCTTTRGSGTAFYGLNMFTLVPSTQSCDTINTQVRSHVPRCITTANRTVTAILVDCWDRGTVLQDVQAINEIISNGGTV